MKCHPTQSKSNSPENTNSRRQEGQEDKPQTGSEKSRGCRFRVRFDEADPAGTAFFGNVYSWHCLGYEVLFQEIFQDYRSWFDPQQNRFAVPLRASHAEHLQPMYAGQEYEVRTRLIRLGRTSFSLASRISHSDGTLCAEVETTHVLAKPTGDGRELEKVEIPQELRSKFADWLSES